jgi:hypothetical protein
MKKTEKNTKNWELLKSQTTELEYKVAEIMLDSSKERAQYLNAISSEEIAENTLNTLKISKNALEQVVQNLFILGFMGKFTVYNENETCDKYWVINPYLTDRGDEFRSHYFQLFNVTTFAMTK